MNHRFYRPMMAAVILATSVLSGCYISSSDAKPSASFTRSTGASYSRPGSSSYYSRSRTSTPSYSSRPSPSYSAPSTPSYTPPVRTATVPTPAPAPVVNNYHYYPSQPRAVTPPPVVVQRTGPSAGSNFMSTMAGAAAGTMLGNALSRHEEDHSSHDSGSTVNPVPTPSPWHGDVNQAQSPPSPAPLPEPTPLPLPARTYTGQAVPEHSSHLMGVFLVICLGVFLGVLIAAFVMRQTPKKKAKQVKAKWIDDLGRDYFKDYFNTSDAFYASYSNGSPTGVTDDIPGVARPVAIGRQAKYVNFYFNDDLTDFLRCFIAGETMSGREDKRLQDAIQFTHIHSVCDTDREWDGTQAIFGDPTVTIGGVVWNREDLGNVGTKVFNGYSTETYITDDYIEHERNVSNVMYSRNLTRTTTGDTVTEYLLIGKTFWVRDGQSYRTIEYYSGFSVPNPVH